MSRKYRRAAVRLPKGVHKVTARGREYYYFQTSRGSKYQGERIRLPNDPHASEFWNAVRNAQGIIASVPTDTIDALIDAYTCSPKFAELKTSTQYMYKRGLKFARDAWGSLSKDQLRPHHIRAVMDGLSHAQGNANMFFGAVQAMSKWAVGRDLLDIHLTAGVDRYKRDTGHKPWSDAQIEEAKKQLTGMIRRGVMLYIYTGQRGSDIVKLGWNDIDEGGFSLKQQKTGREIWCPIVPELAAEMRKWKKEPGPFVKQASGKAFTRAHFSMHFKKEREKYSAIKNATLHGLRATAVVRLRRAGLTTAQIQDIVGMSLAMIERYCRFSDKKAGGKAALISLSERRKNKTVKH